MLKPQDPHFAARVRDSFELQRIMATLRATMSRVEPGEVELLLPFQAQLGQQHGFLHAGIVATLLDSACGYAAYSLMSEAANVLTVEFKVNLLAPAVGEQLRVVGKVIRSGRTLFVCQGDGYMLQGNSEKQVALMQATIMQITT